MTPFLKKSLIVLATGYLLLFYSEMMFWNELEFDGAGLIETAVQMLAMLLLYSAEALAFLQIVSWSRARTPAAVFLAGAAYGWLLEGVLYPTMYDNFPLHIPWTGLAWHALIDIWIGYYWLRRAMQAKSGLNIVALSAGLGLFWGLWNISWYQERTLVTPASFAVVALLETAVLILAYWLINHFATLSFQPTRWSVSLLALLHLAFFLFVVLPAIPWAILVLPPLLFLLYLTLRRNRTVEPADTPASPALPAISPLRYAAIFLMPLVAAASYAFYYTAGFRIPTNVAVFALTSLLSVGLFIASTGRIWRNSRQPDPTQTAPVPMS